MQSFLNSSEINGWDTANVTNMRSTFEGATIFDQDISGWTTSKVTTMQAMFMNAKAFDQDISGWNTSKVTTLTHTFANATAFNQAVGDSNTGWDTSNVTDMTATFQGADSFNQALEWDTSKVASMTYMFAFTDVFNGTFGGGWNTSKVANMASMFDGAKAFNQSLDWDTTKVTNMARMFADTSAFNSDLTFTLSGNGDASTNTMNAMFKNAKGLTNATLDLNTSNVTNMGSMFEEASNFTGAGLESWDVSNVTNMAQMFDKAYAFSADISQWDVSHVTTMQFMFRAVEGFDQDISGWDVSNVENMYYMLQGTGVNQDLGDWNIKSVTNLDFMFANSAMNIANTNATLQGWAHVDTSISESLNSNLLLQAVSRYTDATAVQYLKDHFNWTIRVTYTNLDFGIDDGFQGSLAQKGSNDAEVINATKTTIHALGGNDTVTGTTLDDQIYGGAGDDILAGGLGSDTFWYTFEDAGDDTITDFAVGNGGDVINVHELLMGYTNDWNGFIAAATQTDGNGQTGTLLTIDQNGDDASTRAYSATTADHLVASDQVTVFLAGVDLSAQVNAVQYLIDNGNLVL